jgi:acyl-CoA synthetase (AMP-forming)/AMP-acid ligase II
VKDVLGNSPRSIVEVLGWRAREERDAQAFVQLSSAGEPEHACSCGELHARALAIAARLSSAGPRGSRALLLYPSGVEFVAAFFGCLYAGWVAVPVALPRAGATEPLIVLGRDAGATVFLSTERLLPALSTNLARAGVNWLGIATDTLGSADGSTLHELPAADDLAFLQYTSGSTSQPKGVMIRHRNIVANARILATAGRVPTANALVGWLPLFHDMGLMSLVLLPLLAGNKSVIMPPAAFLQAPITWLREFARHGPSIGGGPNFAYELCLKHVTDEQAATLDLGNWICAFNGAEPVRASTLERFERRFAVSGFRAEAFFTCYGMAEATLFITGVDFAQRPQVLPVDRSEFAQHRVVVAEATSDAQLLVSSGYPGLDHELRIVDPETLKSLEEGREGEIWVSGPSISDGYFGRDADNAAAFRAFTLDDVPRGPFLRSGDLGVLWGGQLFVTGRQKDLLICRGRNLHPNDLEQTAEAAVPLLRNSCGAAFAIDTPDGEGVALAYELERGAKRAADLDLVIRSLRAAILEVHAIRLQAVVLVGAGQIPRTSSGKPRRGLCRALFVAGKLRVLASWGASPSVSLPAGDLAQTHAGEPSEPGEALTRELGSA